MKKRLLTILMVVLSLISGIIIGGCGNSSDQVQANNNNDFEFKYVDQDIYNTGGKKVYVYMDTVTGVQYIINEKGGMCPRYNTDGTLYVEEDLE